MQTFAFLTEIVSLRSFVSIWFWVVTAVFWTLASGRVLGVPYELMARARAGDGKAGDDAAALAEIHARLDLSNGDSFSLFLAFFLVALCLTAGFYLGHEVFAAASFFALPWLILGFLRRKTALYVLGHGGDVPAILARLFRQRRMTQVLAFVFILVSALYGLIHDLNRSVLH